MVITTLFRKVLFMLALMALGISCNQEVHENTTKKSSIMPNGMHIIVEKTTIETTSFGIITKHNYGTSHKFKYKVFVDEGKVSWDFGVGEPKHFLFCKDEVYIHYLNENTYTEEYKDSVTNIISKDYITKVENLYQKYIDKRYLFKLLGDDYWVDISAEEYLSNKKLCSEQAIPNDNELIIQLAD